MSAFVDIDGVLEIPSNVRMAPTHDDLAVILAISFAIQLSALAAIFWMAWRAAREFRESQRLTKAAGVLVIQEAEKIRAMLREL